MMNRAGMVALLSHWRRRPGQLAALILGLMLATGLWSAVQAINAEARASYDRAAALLASQSLTRLARPDGIPLAVADYTALRRAGFLVSPVIETELDGMILLGVDPLTAPPGVIPEDIIAGAADFGGFSGQDVIFGSPETADSSLPSAFSDALPPRTALADIATVARLTGQQDPSYLLVAPTQPAGLPPIDTVTTLELRQPGSANDPGELTGSFHLNLTAFGLLSFGVGLFIAHSAIGLAVEQRRGMIRTLRALGMPLARIVSLMAAELFGLALIAGLLGLALGYAIAAALLPGVAGTLRGLYGAPVSGELGFDPVWALLALTITLIGAGIAGVTALWQVARMPILAPAMPRAWAMRHGKQLTLQAVAALALFALSLALAWMGQGLLIAFAALAALLLGAALALPPALSSLLQAMQPLVRRAYSEWLLADTRQQVPGLSLALMALLLALSTNIGVSTMVGSFRDTFVGWIEQRLGSELYVFAQGDPDGMAAFLAPRADAVLPITGLERPLMGAPGRVRLLADHPTYAEGWPLLSQTPDAWTRLQNGDGIFVNEQLQLRQDLALGDTVEVAPGTTLPILAIYADYGNPQGEAVMGETLFSETFPEVEATGFAVRLDPQDVPALMAALRDERGLGPRDMTDQIAQRELSILIFDRTFQVTGALSALTLGVAGLALLIAFLTLAQMRLGQIAPVWALGATRSQLAWAEIGRALALAALTLVLALPVGLALAWMLLNLVNTQAFGWRLPMSLFPADWLRLAALAFLAAGLAALWPALRLARMAPRELLQVFTHER